VEQTILFTMNPTLKMLMGDQQVHILQPAMNMFAAFFLLKYNAV